MSLSINRKMSCYLTEDANKALVEIVAIVKDDDLALAVLEKLWPEEAIYSIEADEASHG